MSSFSCPLLRAEEIRNKRNVESEAEECFLLVSLYCGRSGAGGGVVHSGRRELANLSDVYTTHELQSADEELGASTPQSSRWSASSARARSSRGPTPDCGSVWFPHRAATETVCVQQVDGFGGGLRWRRGGRPSLRRCGDEGAADALVAAVGPAAAGAQLAHLLG